MSPKEAAAQIVALINASPRSPRPEEIEAVFAKACAGSVESLTHRGNSRLAQVKDMIEKCEQASAKARETFERADIDEADCLGDEFGGLCEVIWLSPVCSIADLQVRALIARHWMDEDWRAPEDCVDWENRTVAELIYAILDMGKEAAQTGEEATA